MQKKGFTQTGRIGRILAAVLAAASACSMGLAGCSGASGEDGGDGKKGARTESGSDLPEGGTPAKGRFMEEEIEFPEEIRENDLIDVVCYPDGSLEFGIPFEKGTARRYRYDSSGWTAGEEIPVPSGIKPGKMLLGEDGTLYYGGFDGDYCFHLWKEGEDGEAQELFSELFAIPEGEDYGVLPDFLAVLADGSLLLSRSSEAAVYDNEGNKRCVLPQDFIGMDVRIPAVVSGTDYYTLNNQEIVRYDLTAGKQTGSFTIPDKKAGDYLGEQSFFTDGASLYVAGEKGLYRTGTDGTMWEQLIDGSLNSMGRQDLYLRKFFKGENGTYYGIYYSNTNAHLFRYYFDETVDAVPPKTLTVYALRDHSTVRQAASVLQKQNPQIRVDFRIAVEDPEEAVTEDVIRALNTELLNGNGADVLILDSLPAETYKKKGILADLSGILMDMQDSLLPNVTKNYLDEEGRLCYLPARVRIPILFGSDEGRGALTSLERMEAYDKEPALFAPDIYENILRLTAHTCYEEIFESSGKIREGALLRWLRAVKSAGEKGQVKTAFNESEMNSLYVNNYVVPDGFGRQSDYNLAGGRCPAAVELLDALDDAMLPLAAAEIASCEITGLNGLYVPSVTVGINAASKNQETAEEFVRVLFGAEVQDESLQDGFAVRSDSLEKWVEMEKEISVSMGVHGMDLYLGGDWPKRRERENILSLVRAALVPAEVDEQIMQMVVDGSRNYLEGKESAEQAVQSIENKMQLYFSERE